MNLGANPHIIGLLLLIALPLCGICMVIWHQLRVEKKLAPKGGAGTVVDPTPKTTSGPHTFQNQSAGPGAPKPTIVIAKGDPGYAEAHKRWLKGQNPTDSPEWKKGLHAVYPFSDEARARCPCIECKPR